MKRKDNVTKTAEVAREFKVCFERVRNRSAQNESREEGVVKRIVEESTIEEIEQAINVLIDGKIPEYDTVAVELLKNGG